jgi:hypothetical protein
MIVKGAGVGRKLCKSSIVSDYRREQGLITSQWKKWREICQLYLSYGG